MDIGGISARIAGINNYATWYHRRRQDLSGLSISATSKIVRVTTQSISEKPDISMITEAEMDKMYHCGSGKLLII